jgi:Rps23 Pro-64 3,4-dihydroxylase Tpa1-like proline 4-hydroxylase
MVTFAVYFTFMNIHEIINPKYISPEAVKNLHEQFENAVPYRYLVLEDFLQESVATALYENFPGIDHLNVKRKSLNEDKSEDYHFERWHPVFSRLRDAIASDEWCAIMNDITGIDGLHTTSDSLGSGVHQGKNGSYVDVHLDVNMNPKTGLWRRINLLIYLNKKWQPEYGGDLEIWDKEMTQCFKKVSPTFNRAVIFLTDDNSPHGYSKINIPEGESRKSFYTYYYTLPEPGMSYRDSKFLSRPNDKLTRKLATSTKETIKIRGKQFLKALGIRSRDFQVKN